VNLFVDTSVWTLALRRNERSDDPTVERLHQALASGEAVFTTGLVLQELLEGFGGPKARAAILDRFSALPLLVPDRGDHGAAAELRNSCRRRGIQIGTVDALLARLCLRHGLVMLTTDRDFTLMAPHARMTVWSP
jgi:predicted nucleic acid-binding protein